MELNWLTISILVILIIILIIFLIKQNIKDERNLEKYLNENDFSMTKDEEELNNEL